MSIQRMSYNETLNYLNSLGFQVKLKIDFDTTTQSIVIQKGGLIFGFGDNDVYGYLITDNEIRTINANSGTYYVTMSKSGSISVSLGNYQNVRGIGANIPGIPWYTYNDNALIAKIFRPVGLVEGIIICDDPYWCEYEW